MKKFILTAALILVASTAQAGPICSAGKFVGQHVAKVSSSVYSRSGAKFVVDKSVHAVVVAAKAVAEGAEAVGEVLGKV